MPLKRFFNRKPACSIRQKHGGFNSTFPMNHHTVIQQAAIQQAAMKAYNLKLDIKTEISADNNILNFAEHAHNIIHKRVSARLGRRD